jgi:acyl-CoA thioesterase-2
VEFVDVLELERVGPGRYVGRSDPGWTGPRVFGGQILAQAVVAGARALDSEKQPHSLHAQFLQAGERALPLEYRVHRVREGRSFATQRIELWQGDNVRFVAFLSSGVATEGLEYAPRRDLSTVPSPGGDLPTYGEWFGTTADRASTLVEGRPTPIEIRYVNPPPAGAAPTEPQLMWLRVAAPLPDDPVLHAAALAYASDETLVDNVMLPHGLRWSDERLTKATLDHAMWFLRSANANEWLLFEQIVVSTSSARGVARGDMYTTSGMLVLTTTQQGLMRLA